MDIVLTLGERTHQLFLDYHRVVVFRVLHPQASTGVELLRRETGCMMSIPACDQAKSTEMAQLTAAILSLVCLPVWYRVLLSQAPYARNVCDFRS